MSAVPMSSATSTGWGRDARRAALSPLSRAMLAVENWFARAEGRAALGRMSDRELADIGLSRAAARQEIDKPFWTA